ncbi:MAG TPA: flagellar assembly peptidoglycan hydrolase FlgJ, partial [Gammaproteobacteria bacterium]|nr:flagellar assembly peptidoglycan hydrolase FlgJ [Gammaproteobacteria bacterium]
RSFSTSSQLQVAQQDMKLALDKSLFEGPQSFVKTLQPYAADAADALGIHPRFIVAQAALESGWGESMIHKANGQPSYNLFGIKAAHGWRGEKAIKETVEYEQGVAIKKQEAFRAYQNLEAGMQDYVAFLSTSPRYQEVLASGDDAQAFVSAMQQSGYATDPQYANKLLNVLESDLIHSVIRE